jgi:hypothetical protein
MAKHATGTQLQIGDGATTEVFTTIAEVNDISGPSIETETIETTSHDNVDGYKTYIAGLSDGGEVTFSINYDLTLPTHGAVTGNITLAALNRTIRNFRIVLLEQGGQSWSFRGLVTNFETKYPAGDKQTAEITIKVLNKPQLTAGSVQ